MKFKKEEKKTENKIEPKQNKLYAVIVLWIFNDRVNRQIERERKSLEIKFERHIFDFMEM